MGKYVLVSVINMPLVSLSISFFSAQNKSGTEDAHKDATPSPKKEVSTPDKKAGETENGGNVILEKLSSPIVDNLESDQTFEDELQPTEGT